MVSVPNNSAEVKAIASAMVKWAFETGNAPFRRQDIQARVAPTTKPGNITASISQMAKGGLLVAMPTRGEYTLGMEAIAFKCLHSINRQAGARRRKAARAKAV